MKEITRTHLTQKNHNLLQKAYKLFMKNDWKFVDSRNYCYFLGFWNAETIFYDNTQNILIFWHVFIFKIWIFWGYYRAQRVIKDLKDNWK